MEVYIDTDVYVLYLKDEDTYLGLDSDGARELFNAIEREQVSLCVSDHLFNELDSPGTLERDCCEWFAEEKFSLRNNAPAHVRKLSESQEDLNNAKAVAQRLDSHTTDIRHYILARRSSVDGLVTKNQKDFDPLKKNEEVLEHITGLSTPWPPIWIPQYARAEIIQQRK